MATVYELAKVIPEDQSELTAQLLSEGWEPFGLDSGRLWLRRARPIERATEVMTWGGDDGYFTIEVGPISFDSGSEFDRA